MHLASFAHDGQDHIGVRLDDEQLVIVTDLLPHPIDPTTQMDAVIAGGPSLLDRLATRQGDGSAPRIAAAAVRWHPPIRRPGKIIGVAMNNSASDARKIAAPQHPLFFTKPRTCLVGHRQPIEVRSYYRGVHPEPELAVVIGKTGRDLAPSQALDHIFGYTIFNDLTGNDMRGEDMVHYYALYASPSDPTVLEKREQHLSYAARYKGTDGFGPIGPWLVTADAVPDPDVLDVVCTVGGHVIARDSTRYLTYSVAEILSYLSHFQTLEPGDVVSMGTAFRQQPGEKRSLHSANLQVVDGPVEVSITGLGTLSNPVHRIEMGLPNWRLPSRTGA
ncbi:fumarylacetoacetate hydrolase family protein [Sphingomonas sp. CGMCC 1.13654]|uniref:Fumarylacetoacetate hydrolase family protein n=1 Tax=Sphingomonas chungangi TaxID=2683589 RepID=A0A838L8Y1_9SPHN|nr:fumarylacetoacetate hydrolase family protein [Sphingomonas chungangi]MBA2933968.1 fumarylacetoacetate hydrolase family protein [Sphingomonas chungangi]MVW57093.1 FAA hydrolase family protein [Sphingomonas chungangi]